MNSSIKLTTDMTLKEITEIAPEVKHLLMDYGLKKLVDEDIYDILYDKLTIRGFFRAMKLCEEDQDLLWEKIQVLYNNS